MKTIVTLFVIIVLGTTAYGIVEEYNRDYRQQQIVAERRDDDRLLCRAYLGIDYDLGFRKTMMSCAADVQAGRPAVGHMRSTLADKAWRQCMPDLSPCERALR